MRLLLLIITALIVYGSLYPFAFSLSAFDAAGAGRLLTVDPLGTSRSDILANVALFLPFGLVGTLDAGRRGGGLRPVLPVLLLGLALAVALQVAQLFLPSRFPTLTDVVWNGLGLLLGSLVAAIPFVRRLLRGLERVPALSVPLLLIAAWLVYRLYPFVPSLDVQVVKDGLKPLLVHPRLSALGVLHDFVAWSIVLHLWATAWRRGDRDRLPLLLIAGVFAAELIIVDNAVSVGDVAGALLAVAVWRLVLYRLPGRVSWLAAILIALLVLQGLAPFEPRAVPTAVNWVPFAGALEGSTAAGFLSLAEKLFLYGSLAWLLLERRFGRMTALLIVAGVLGLIEAAQTRFAHHTPEVTDPLLGAAIVLLLSLGGGRGRSPVPWLRRA